MRQAVDRARTAFYRQLIRMGERHPPLVTTAVLAAVHDQGYVVLGNDTGVLAVYKITSTGALQRQHHWPQALEECVEHSCSR